MNPGGFLVLGVVGLGVAASYLYGLGYRAGAAVGMRSGHDRAIQWHLENGVMPEGWQESPCGECV